MLRGCQEDALKLGKNRTVHISQLKFVFEIRDCAQAAQHTPRILALGKICQQVAKANYLDVIQSFDEAARNQVVEWLGTIVTAQQDRAQEVVDQLPLPF